MEPNEEGAPLDEAPGWISWNWAAFFGTLAWLRYRRLYRWSWLYLFFSTPVLIVAGLLPAAGDACQGALNPARQLIEYAIEALVVVSWVVPPLFADRLYYNEVLLKDPNCAYADESRRRIDALNKMLLGTKE